MAIELRHFRYFVAVAEELHFGRAAKRLHISQPPLSQQIIAMEQELGAKLFTRTKRRVVLTKAGEQLLPQARMLLEDAERAIQTTISASEGQRGLLRIGFTGSFPFMTIMPDTLRSYTQAYPLVTLRLQEMSTIDQIDALQSRNIDVGFVRMIPRLSSSRVDTKLLATETLIVALPNGHRLNDEEDITMELLADEPFIMYEQEAGAGIYNQIVGLCQTAGFTPRISQHARHMPTIVSLVAAGIGISLVSPAMKRMNLGQVCYRDITVDTASTSVVTETRTDLLIATRPEEPSALVQNFVDQASRKDGS